VGLHPHSFKGTSRGLTTTVQGKSRTVRSTRASKVGPYWDSVGFTLRLNKFSLSVFCFCVSFSFFVRARYYPFELCSVTQSHQMAHMGIDPSLLCSPHRKILTPTCPACIYRKPYTRHQLHSASSNLLLLSPCSAWCPCRSLILLARSSVEIRLWCTEISHVLRPSANRHSFGRIAHLGFDSFHGYVRHTK